MDDFEPGWHVVKSWRPDPAAVEWRGARPWLKLSTLGNLVSMLESAWEPSNSRVLARVWIDCDWVILVRLHWEIASSGTRWWSSCMPVVLVTLGGCHLLNGLVVVSIEARKEDCAVLRRSDCKGFCARPTGATNSNSSRACHWVPSSYGGSYNALL
jgi:hypothetical protein